MQNIPSPQVRQTQGRGLFYIFQGAIWAIRQHSQIPKHSASLTSFLVPPGLSCRGGFHLGRFSIYTDSHACPAGCHGLKKDAEVPECGCVLHAIRVHVFTAISCLQHVRTPRTMSDTTSRDYSGAYPTLPSMCCLDLRVYCSKLEQPVGLLDQCLCPGLQGRHEPFR